MLEGFHTADFEDLSVKILPDLAFRIAPLRETVLEDWEWCFQHDQPPPGLRLGIVGEMPLEDEPFMLLLKSCEDFLNGFLGNDDCFAFRVIAFRETVLFSLFANAERGNLEHAAEGVCERCLARSGRARNKEALPF